MEYYAAADIGGTNIAVCIINEKAEIIAKTSIKTNSRRGFQPVIDEIAQVVGELTKTAEAEVGTPIKLTHIGVGCPGSVTGGVVYSAKNLGWDNVPLEKALSAALKIPACADNDANTAALGEYIAGAAAGNRDIVPFRNAWFGDYIADAATSDKRGGRNTGAVIITLGTGIGGGIVMNGRAHSGVNGGAGEIGHMVIVSGGRECNCGRRGCFEQYASATALVRMTAEAIDRERGDGKDSVMGRLAEEYGKVSARTAFAAAKQGDGAAAELVDTFIGYLACGVANIINILQPDIVCIGGGLCNEGDTLLLPLREKLSEIVFTRGLSVNTKVALCSLGNDAGLIGAAFIRR